LKLNGGGKRSLFISNILENLKLLKSLADRETQAEVKDFQFCAIY